MGDEQPYRLIPEALPRPRGRKGEYDRIIDDFVSGDADSVVVEYGERKTATVYQGLYHSLKTNGRTDVKLRRRGDKVYLVRG